MTEATILDRIVAAKRVRLAGRVTPLAELQAAARGQAPAIDFDARLRHGERVAVIAEIKRASPSRGALDLELDPAAQARLYAGGGAVAISVLCEEDHFAGSLDDLRAVKAAAPALPVLCKDFIIDPCQVWEARAAGADSVLLILALLDDALASDLMQLARQLGMEPLVEVHDEAEAGRAVQLGAAVIGINNRDLRRFVTDLAVTDRLAPWLRTAAPDALVVSESGIASGADVARVRDAGAAAVLVGEAVVVANDRAARLAELTAVPRLGRTTSP